jgi:ribokinase
MGSKVIVVGSYSAAVFFKGKTIPVIGETRIADTFFQTFGGKGSNQAVCAAKLGADVRFICKIGVDRYAEEVIDLYKQVNIYSPSVMQDPATPTSIGAIFIDEKGSNSIMIFLGANTKLTSGEIIQWVKEEKDPFIVGFQLESDLDMVVESIEAVSKMGIKTLLDPAPAAKLPESIYPYITYIKPNEHEAKILSGIEINTPEDAYCAGEWFIDKGVKAAIITLGEAGAVLVEKNTRRYFTAIKTEASDTTGAGDIFSGALMAALSRGFSFEKAIQYASCAASISVTRMGVVESIPTQEEARTLFEQTFEGDANK